AVRLITSSSCSFSKRYTTRKNPSRVPAGTSDRERSVSVKRVAKVFHAVGAGSRSQPKIRPTKNRTWSSIRTSEGGLHRQLVTVSRKLSSVTPARQRGRSTNHTS